MKKGVNNMSGSNNIKQKDFLELNDVKERLSRLKSNASREVLGSRGFYYYTTLDTFSKIFDNKEIWIRNVSNMNDRKEFVLDPQLEKEKKFYHLFCFSNSDVESIPMWYMYSGISGNGVRIKFTSLLVKEIINNCKLYTPAGDLLCKDDYEVKAGWVYYRYRDGYYKLNNKSYTVCDWNKSFYKDNMFVKSHHWLYEKEFRIVIKNRLDEEFDYLKLDISAIFDKLTFTFGPEFEYSELKKYPILKGVRKSGRFKNSTLDISMGLIKNP
ncbi:MAG TPA: hypothetical protein PK631_00270 [Erysipelotrichaceae bacterium]|nr:hypothetical protein [Erysipelotrichaceae bacterium]